MQLFSNSKIIAAVRNKYDFDKALHSKSENIFLLAGNILELPEYTELAKKYSKRLFLHVDMIDGLGKDAAALEYVSTLSPFGIISTRGNIIKYAKNLGLCTVQRFFIVDGKSVNTALESVRQTKPSYAEIMPGIAYKVISAFANENVPVIAGGLINTPEEASLAINAGAVAISTSDLSLFAGSSLEKNV